MKLRILTHAKGVGQLFCDEAYLDPEFSIQAVLELNAACVSLDIKPKRRFFWDTCKINHSGRIMRPIPPSPYIMLEIDSVYEEKNLLVGILNAIDLAKTVSRLNELTGFSQDIIESYNHHGRSIDGFSANAYFLAREVEKGYKTGVPSENFLRELKICESFFPRLQAAGWDVTERPN